MQEWFVILKLHRDDLKERGFDTTGVSDKQMEAIAEGLGSDFVENGSYWESLEALARTEGLVQTEEEE